MSDDPWAEIRTLFDEITAARLMDEVVDEHRRKYLKILVHPHQHEKIRQAVCNVDPQLESAVISSVNVSKGQAIFMDTSILERSFLPDLPLP